jgi:GNAT superfamily N-acetyltransferase
VLSLGVYLTQRGTEVASRNREEWMRIATELDIEGILNLQAQNLYTNLSSDELADGFVTTPFTPELIRSLLAQDGAFIAESEGRIVGYILAGGWEFYSQWEIFRLMVDRLPELSFQGKKIAVDRSFQYGPVCVDRAFRGSGILSQLFETMQSNFAPRFPIGVTFINKLNHRSLAAHHRKLNFEIIDEFEFNNGHFHTLAFSTDRTV